MIAGGSWWFFERENNPPIVIGSEETGPSLGTQKDTISEIVFELDGNIGDSTYLTHFLKLNKYRFKFDKQKWSYMNKKGKNKYDDFYHETINQIKKVDSLDFDEDKFKKSLEEISGEKIIYKKDLVTPGKQKTQKNITPTKPSEPNKTENRTPKNNSKNVIDLEKVGNDKV